MEDTSLAAFENLERQITCERRMVACVDPIRPRGKSLAQALLLQKLLEREPSVILTGTAGIRVGDTITIHGSDKRYEAVSRNGYDMQFIAIDECTPEIKDAPIDKKNSVSPLFNALMKRL